MSFEINASNPEATPQELRGLLQATHQSIVYLSYLKSPNFTNPNIGFELHPDYGDSGTNFTLEVNVDAIRICNPDEADRLELDPHDTLHISSQDNSATPGVGREFPPFQRSFYLLAHNPADSMYVATSVTVEHEDSSAEMERSLPRIRTEAPETQQQSVINILDRLDRVSEERRAGLYAVPQAVVRDLHAIVSNLDRITNL